MIFSNNDNTPVYRVEIKPERLGMEQALEFAVSNLTIPLNKWLPKSKILQDARYQRRISEYA
ncbi:MAG: hypothetical protein HMLIMOIP_000052 [Candidatus Nitrosomirales archaeon]|jgi:hypothetical protein